MTPRSRPCSRLLAPAGALAAALLAAAPSDARPGWPWPGGRPAVTVDLGALDPPAAAAPARIRLAPPPRARPALPPAVVILRPPARPAPPPQAAPEPPSSPGAFAPRSRYTLDFAPGQTAVGGAAGGALDRVARRLESDSRLRVHLAAYAGGPGSPAGAARRLSLARALAVRSYLIDKGVSSTRIDVRAFGGRTAGGAPDRVDATISRR